MQDHPCRVGAIGCARFLFRVALAITFVQAGHAATAPKSWTVQDSIAVKYFVAQKRGSANPSDGFYDDPIAPSPDGRHIFFVTRYGDLRTDRNVSELQVFSMEKIGREFSNPQAADIPRPERSITFQSSWSDAKSPIAGAYWHDSDTIVFAGTQDQGHRRIYRLDISSGRLEALSSPDHDVVDISLVGVQNRSIVYQSRRATIPTPVNTYPLFNLNEKALREALGASVPNVESHIYAAYNGGTANPVATLASSSRFVGGPWMSPDGRYAVMVLAQVRWPASPSWSAYELSLSAPYRFVVVDLRRGESYPMFDAPVGTATSMGRSGGAPFFDVAWTESGRHVAILNTTLPIGSEYPERSATSYVVAYSVEERRWSALEPLVSKDGVRAFRVEGIPGHETFVISHRTGTSAVAPSVAYSLCSARWVPSRASLNAAPRSQRPLAGGVSVTLRQDANTPPVVVATRGNKSLPLTRPDPALSGIWRAELQPFTWFERDGHAITGGLMLPRERHGEGVPLVIQAFYYKPHFFRPDGYSFSADAAQALVAEGIAVLFMDIPAASGPPDWKPEIEHWRRVVETPDEGRVFVQNLDAAVQALSAAKLISAERVGLSGFSRGGFMTHYAVTHPGNTKLRAAVVADSYTGSYFEYVLNAATAPAGTDFSQDVAVFDRQYGTGTFWKNKSGWLSGAPGFNADSVLTPTLFSMHKTDTMMYTIETFGVWRLNRRPFDYVFLPDSFHQPQRPREREALMTVAVDWMKFWLQGKMPQDPERRTRWQQISADWRHVSVMTTTGID